jgi:hypothetical protein
MEGRWRWLLPWTWILGAWANQRREADFVLDVCVRGSGLATCSGVLVRAAACCLAAHALTCMFSSQTWLHIARMPP